MMEFSDPSLKSYTKKLYCPSHGSKFTFKCQYKFCQQAFLCSSPQCFEDHFHKENEGKLIIKKFDSISCVQKLSELERIFTKEDFAIQAKQLKSFIDELKSSMVSIYKDYKELHNRKESLLGDFNKPFQFSLIDKVEESIELGKNLRKSLDSLRGKINISAVEQNSALIEKPQSLSEKKALSDQNFQPKKNQQRFESVDISFESHRIEPIEVESQSKSAQNGSEKSNKNYGNQHSVKKINLIEAQESFEDLFKNSQSKRLNMYSNKKVQENDYYLTKNQNNLNGVSNKSGNPSEELQNTNQSLALYEKDFFMKKQITIFFQNNIKNFSWGTVQQVYSSHQPLISIEKFHDLLQGRKNLLFLFICQDKILGSFYPTRYPRLTQKLRNDCQSFLFLSNQKREILKYVAIQSQFHLCVSDKLYVCHGNTSYGDGIRTFEKNFNTINYCLPSGSYKYEHADEGNKNNHSGCIKMKQFYVLQIDTTN